MMNLPNAISSYLAGKSCKEIAVDYNCNAMTIYKHLIRNDVPMRKKWEGRTLKMPHTNLSELEKQIVEGCLLGDASVLRKNERCTSHFTLTTIHEEFIKHTQNELLLPKFRVRERINGKRKFYGKKYKCKKSYEIVSTVDKSLNIFRETWYPNGIKIVPKSLKLSPATVRYWFYCDGSSSYIKYKGKNTYVRVTFCTNGFKVEDCEFLSSSLENICGPGFNIYLSRKQPMLIASRTDTIMNFFNYIGDCDMSCFKYKWKTPAKYAN